MTPKKEPDPVVGIRLPEELKKQLFERAKNEDITPSQIVRHLLKGWLNQEPPTIGLGR